MPITDTSWLYAFLDELDVHHEEAIAQAKQADQLAIPGPVVAEFLHLVHYRVRKSSGEAEAHRAARQALQDLSTTPTVSLLDGADLHGAAGIYHRHPKLSFVDAVAIAAALRGQDRLLTFDKVQRAALAKER
jgi:predicted nucleic acid-binding protein